MPGKTDCRHRWRGTAELLTLHTHCSILEISLQSRNERKPSDSLWSSWKLKTQPWCSLCPLPSPTPSTLPHVCGLTPYVPGNKANCPSPPSLRHETGHWQCPPKPWHLRGIPRISLPFLFEHSWDGNLYCSTVSQLVRMRAWWAALTFPSWQLQSRFHLHTRQVPSAPEIKCLFKSRFWACLQIFEICEYGKTFNHRSWSCPPAQTLKCASNLSPLSAILSTEFCLNCLL